jgi:hypothetical protein
MRPNDPEHHLADNPGGYSPTPFLLAVGVGVGHEAIGPDRRTTENVVGNLVCWRWLMFQGQMCACAWGFDATSQAPRLVVMRHCCERQVWSGKIMKLQNDDRGEGRHLIAICEVVMRSFLRRTVAKSQLPACCVMSACVVGGTVGPCALCIPSP